MMDWRVLGDEERLPASGEEEPRAPRSRWRLWPWFLLALLIVVSVGAVIVWQAREREERLRADLTSFIEQEARTQAFGVPEQAREFVDPDAGHAWRERYSALFRESALAQVPLLEEADWSEESRVQVTVAWPEAAAPFTERRAYRLVDGAWRRTPLVLEPETVTVTQRSTYFEVRASAEDGAALADDPALRLNLERLRSRVVTYWPDTWDDFFLTITVQPQELSNPVYFADAQKLFINSPALALADPASPLPPKAQYRLAVTTAVVQWLASPAWLRTMTLENPERTISPGLGNWISLWQILQQAEARQWALDSDQRRLLRNAWREELDGEWPDPFGGHLPIDPTRADDAARRRWVGINLLVERQIEIGGVGTPGRLATTMERYGATSDFDVGQLFSAMIGGSLNDVEQLSRDYLLTPEPAP